MTQLTTNDALALPAEQAALTTRSRSRSRLGDYVELAKPRLNFLVLVTTAVGFFMAVTMQVQWLAFVHTMLGTALTAAAASMLNQWWERGLDARMKRTALRPLAAGRIAPAEALWLGIGTGAAGVLWLGLGVNWLTAGLGAATLLLYVLVYTPLKRTTTLCTVVGAVPGAIPPVMGFTAVTGAITPEALAIFAILFVWQMPHFLAIAILYRDDYARAGFAMLPVVDRDGAVTGRQIVLYCAALIPVSLVPYGMLMSDMTYLASALILGLAMLMFGIRAAQTRQRSDARWLFVASILYLPLLLAMLMVDKL